MDKPIPDMRERDVFRELAEVTGCHALFSFAGEVWLPTRAVVGKAGVMYVSAWLADCSIWFPRPRTVIERHYGLLVPLCAVPEAEKIPLPKPINCRECTGNSLEHIDCTVCRSLWPADAEIEHGPGLPRYGL